MKNISYSPFQQASIRAAVRHFQEHDKVLCADEAGLGKTIIARGIIEELARQKLEQEYDRCGAQLPSWWKAFQNANPQKNYDYATYRRDALDDFQRACGLGLQKTGNDGRAKMYTSFMGEIGKAISEQPVTRERFRAAVRNLPRLIMMENGTGRQRRWDLKLPSDDGVCSLPAEPFRVLYVCCNLAIAEQNTRRLTPLPQNSDRGAADKPDRLSVLWYYLKNYPTPYLEIMPITATISTSNTPGSAKEREILRTDDISKVRPLGEKKSLDIYHPDLVIFDEFQNFADILTLCSKEDDAFERYLDDLSGEDIVQRTEAMRRTRWLFQTLLKREKPPKLLMLSATPFHAAEYHSDAQRENINQINLNELLDFLGGSREAFDRAADKEEYLYNTCGILRNQRIRLLGKDNTAYHLLACEGAGLLAPALRLHGEGGGNCARRAVFTTPHIDRVCQMYQDNQEAYSLCDTVKVDPDAHPRYRRLLQVVTARQADDVTEQQTPGLTRPADRLNQLLWIPPVRPSRPLGGVFAEFAGYSKTLVYSGLKVTPGSVTDLLNKEVQYCQLKMTADEQEKLETYLENCLAAAGFPDEKADIAKKLCQYILNCGGAALGESAAAAEVQRYCEDGCLVDVLREYLALLEDPADAAVVWRSLGDAPAVFARPMNMVTPEIRGIFNAPFLPFVVMTTSIGAEGLDFHLYCNRLAHYTAPAGVVELEQKNGRIDRRNSLAVRRFWARPGMQFRLEQNRAALEKKSGGLVPLWDAGEGNLHYYFFYTQFTREKKKLQNLLEEQKTYREQIGAHTLLEADTFNLCPYLRENPITNG